MPLKPADERRGTRWYAVQARPRSEDVALRHMANQDFVTFCPRARQVRKVGRHRVEGFEPFFRGYFFVELDLERDPWRSINGTIGVVRVVAFGGTTRPVPMPTGLVEQLMSLCGPGDHLALDDLSFGDRLRPGDTVRVMTGPFADLCGVLQSVAGGERVTVLLDILSRDTRVELSRYALARAA